MSWSVVCKVLQRRTISILSHRYGTVCLIGGLIMVLVSAFQFAEVLMEWSEEKYSAVFNSFSDNVAERSFRDRLCLPVPIDVVYTWVNGSDPKLLSGLHAYKRQLELEMRNHTRGDCHFAHCVRATLVVLEPSLSVRVDRPTLAALYPAFQQATNMFLLASHSTSHNASDIPGQKGNVTVVTFDTMDDVHEALLLKSIVIESQNISVRKVYYTSEWSLPNTIPLRNTLLLTGFPSSVTVNQIRDALPTEHTTSLSKFHVHEESGVAVIVLADESEAEQLQRSNMSIAGKVATVNTASLVWDLNDYSYDEEVSASRFADNEEMRYSLRSIAKFAPWIRHVYIVTNGQIPSWLNLENPRLTIVTHQEIFVNKSHLPTFSSPAIECHLHRIPGLSAKFLYMNDDVMFGQEVWPDDFYTQAHGQKIYLTWPVPSCKDDCPSTWIKDGYCDLACNHSECDWDGGDCLGSSKNSFALGPRLADWPQSPEQASCHTGCANSWVADRYCDPSCNVKTCAFDAGDCGTANFHRLHIVHLRANLTHYVLPAGELVAVFNVTSMFDKVDEASHNESKAIRVVALAQPLKVITLLLYPGHNATTVQFYLAGKNAHENTVQYNFTVAIDTHVLSKSADHNETVAIRQGVNGSVVDDDVMKTGRRMYNETAVDHIVFKDVPETLRSAKPAFVKAASPPPTGNFSLYELPDHLAKKLADLKKEFELGELTEKGMRVEQADLWQSFMAELKEQGKQLVQRQEQNMQLRAADGAGRNRSGQRHLLWLPSGDVQEPGFLPWEKLGVFSALQKQREKLQLQKSYETDATRHQRHLLDTFGDSLRHVNSIYNKAFGFDSRKVPAHMPHLVDKNIMAELHSRFAAEWDETSSHRSRSTNDMQFSFSYFYYIVGEKTNVTIDDVFEKMDLDNSGVLSDRELRVFATRVFELPLTLLQLTSIEDALVNCSSLVPHHQMLKLPFITKTETYYDRRMPQITKKLFCGCPPIQELVSKSFTGHSKYRYELVNDDQVTFKMIQENVSHVVRQLDEVRKAPKKFICLNDNIAHDQKNALEVKAVLQDFYESLLPEPSSFELPPHYRNRFMYIEDLREWKRERDWLKMWTQVALVSLLVFTILSYFSSQLCSLFRPLIRRWQRRLSAEQPHAQRRCSDCTQPKRLMVV